MDLMVLQALFPTVSAFGNTDPGMLAAYMNTSMQITPEEASAVRMRVARHLRSEMDYNAGFGGHGSYSGREVTTS